MGEVLLEPSRLAEHDAAGGKKTLAYRGTSLIRNCLLLGQYSRPVHRALQWSCGRVCFLCARCPCTPERDSVLPLSNEKRTTKKDLKRLPQRIAQAKARSMVQCLERRKGSQRTSERRACSKCTPEEGRCKATWQRDFNIAWRVASPPNHHDDKVDSDQ